MQYPKNNASRGSGPSGFRGGERRSPSRSSANNARLPVKPLPSLPRPVQYGLAGLGALRGNAASWLSLMYMLARDLNPEGWGHNMVIPGPINGSAGWQTCNPNPHCCPPGGTGTLSEGPVYRETSSANFFFNGCVPVGCCAVATPPAQEPRAASTRVAEYTRYSGSFPGPANNWFMTGQWRRPGISTPEWTHSTPVEAPYLYPGFRPFIPPAIDPFALPIDQPAEYVPLPYKLIPARTPNPRRAPQEQPQRGPATSPSRRPGRPLPSPRLAPGFSQSIAGVPGASIIITPTEEVFVAPSAPANPKPPREGVKERKFRATYGVAGGVYGAITEGKDFIESFYGALPKDKQKCGKNGSPQCMLNAIYNGWDDVDINKAIKNLINNEINDRLPGAASKAGKGKNDGGGYYDRPVGPTHGQSYDRPDNPHGESIDWVGAAESGAKYLGF